MVTTKTLIGKLLAFQVMQLRRLVELNDGVKTRDSRRVACADQVLAI